MVFEEHYVAKPDICRRCFGGEVTLPRLAVLVMLCEVERGNPCAV